MPNPGQTMKPVELKTRLREGDVSQRFVGSVPRSVTRAQGAFGALEIEQSIIYLKMLVEERKHLELEQLTRMAISASMNLI